MNHLFRRANDLNDRLRAQLRLAANLPSDVQKVLEGWLRSYSQKDRDVSDWDTPRMVGNTIEIGVVWGDAPVTWERIKALVAQFKRDNPQFKRVKGTGHEGDPQGATLHITV